MQKIASNDSCSMESAALLLHQGGCKELRRSYPRMAHSVEAWTLNTAPIAFVVQWHGSCHSEARTGLHAQEM
jgi:hypothetical protein